MPGHQGRRTHWHGPSSSGFTWTPWLTWTQTHSGSRGRSGSATGSSTGRRSATSRGSRRVRRRVGTGERDAFVGAGGDASGVADAAEIGAGADDVSADASYVDDRCDTGSGRASCASGARSHPTPTSSATTAPTHTRRSGSLRCGSTESPTHDAPLRSRVPVGVVREPGELPSRLRARDTPAAIPPRGPRARRRRLRGGRHRPARCRRARTTRGA